MTSRFLLWMVLTLLPLALGDADFWDVRTSLDRDRSGKKGDPKQKYFRMSLMSMSARTSISRLQMNLRMSSSLTAITFSNRS